LTWLLLLSTIGLTLWVLSLRRRYQANRENLAARDKELGMLRNELDSRSGRLDRYAALVAGAGLGMMVLDPDGVVVQANPAAAEFVRARYGAALAEAKIPVLASAAVAARGRLQEEFDFRTPMPRTYRITAEPIESTEWVIAYVEDVTERRKVDAARTDFVANVSHELKTPLGALALLAETLETAGDPEVRRKLINRIGEQAARMTRLVDDIMDLSLVEASGIEPAVVELHKVLAAAAADVRDIAVAAGVELDVSPGEGDIHVYGDERQLVSAVGNLLSNAVAYTAVAAPPHRVVAKAYRRGPDTVIEVSDTGIGIPAKHQQRIFERFYRVDSARSRETGGTGLGLAIVRHVALNHGGSVEVESESGIGSTFRIVLPAAEDSQ
jgi:two-component system sensor histidine kinase SenX3